MSTLPTLPAGFPTHSVDITGQRICLGDVVVYDFAGDDPCPFTVVFEDNAFRKQPARWQPGQPKALLEVGELVKTMRLKVLTAAVAS